MKKKCDFKHTIDPKKTIDLATLPPCLKSLTQHIKRANYQTAIWKSAQLQFPEVPAAELHGWVTGPAGLEPVWCDGDVLPSELIDVLEDWEDPDSEVENLSEDVNLSDDSDSE